LTPGVKPAPPEVKILLDEDVPFQLLAGLSQILDGHQVDHVDSLHWKSKKDLRLLPDAAKRGYEVLVTNDKNQLHDVDECKAIRASRLHHVRYDTSSGKEGLALAMAAVLAAAVPCMRELEAADTQRLVLVTSIKAHRRGARYQVIDPVSDPPAYWPRSGTSPRRPRRS
jgi:PIN like domain